jgi:hypothetical protein
VPTHLATQRDLRKSLLSCIYVLWPVSILVVGDMDPSPTGTEMPAVKDEPKVGHTGPANFLGCAEDGGNHNDVAEPIL